MNEVNFPIEENYKYKDIIEQNRQFINNKYNYEDLINIVRIFINDLPEPYFISLSGGVDSMVLLVILRVFLKKQVVAIHINYNNREECNLEQEFLELFCSKNCVSLHSKKMDFKRCDTDRRDYEISAKKERFSFYSEVINKYSKYESNKIAGIFLGHHKDDSVENIFNNLMNCRNLMDLAVIKDSSSIMGVNIFRPFINVFKEQVYHFSNYFEIIYFNDTTPEWSMRGRFRNEVFPLIEKYYCSPKQNLLQVSQQVSEWGSCIHELVIKPILNNDIQFVYNDYNKEFQEVTISYSRLLNCPESIWNYILMVVFHKIGENCPSRKSIINLIFNVKNLKNKNSKYLHRVILMKVFNVYINNLEQKMVISKM